MSRKPLSKKIRFEVFKRDHFTCQYCGRMAPDAILEVDHIKPVAEGGDNELVNLITSCRDCNRGKGKRRLSDNDALKRQQKALEELSIRREQVEMMAEWRQSLAVTVNEMAEKISDYIGEVTGYGLGKNGIIYIKKVINQFSFEEVMEAIDIAFDRYYDGSDVTWVIAFEKIGGICYNRRHNVVADSNKITVTLDNQSISRIEEEAHDEGIDDIGKYISKMLRILYSDIQED